MGPLDRTALDLARGRVLDVGAGAGAHALPLLERGLALTALELLPEAARVLRSRGVPEVVEESLWAFRGEGRYDTVLALMNGTALAGTAGGLPRLLQRFSELIADGGQVLIDSTDLADAEDAEEVEEAPAPQELHFQLEYAGECGAPFPQLFLPEAALARAAAEAGWSSTVVAREGERYLARLLRSGGGG